MKKYIPVIIIAFIAQISASQEDIVDALQNRLVGMIGTYRTVPNSSSKVYITIDGEDYYYEHAQSRMFPSKQDIDGMKIISISKGFASSSDYQTGPRSKVRSLDKSSSSSNGHIRIIFEHPHLKRGYIKIYNEEKQFPENVDHIIQILGYAFEADGIPHQALYAGDKKTKVLYFVGCNHLPEETRLAYFETVDEAINQGYTPSPLSFAQTPQLSSLEEELLLGTQASAELRYYYPIHPNDEYQAKFRKLGFQVLLNWPTTLKGYNYRFYVLDSDAINAVACPGGKIFVTSGLFESLENEDEIEAVIAHEIAHVEKRHGLRQLRSAQIGAAVGTLLSLGMAAAAYESDNSNAALAAGITGMIANVASSIAIAGYSRKQESESDMYAAMYLMKNDKDPKILARVLKKFRYHNDLIGIEGDQPNLFSSHPGLKERVYIAEHSTFQFFENTPTFDGYTKDGELVATIKFDAEFLYEENKSKQTYSLLAELITTTALEKEDKVKEIDVIINGKRTRIKNSEESFIYPLDTMSLTFETDKSGIGFLNNINEIDLDLGPVDEWVKR